jgi:hypothetical protein
MSDITTIKGNNNLVIDFSTTPVVKLTCTDNFGNVWSELNVTLTASGLSTQDQTILLPQISTLYPLNTIINFTLDSSMGMATITPYSDLTLDLINGSTENILLKGDNSTIPFTSISNNNWIVPQLLVSGGKLPLADGNLIKTEWITT